MLPWSRNRIPGPGCVWRYATPPSGKATVSHRITQSANGSSWKPGLDFYDDGAGHVGQAKLLQSYAASHNIRQVDVSIGGNDFNFASVVQTCVEDWLLSPSWWKDYCNDDSSVTSNFTASNVAAQRAKRGGSTKGQRPRIDITVSAIHARDRPLSRLAGIFLDHARAEIDAMEKRARRTGAKRVASTTARAARASRAARS